LIQHPVNALRCFSDVFQKKDKSLSLWLKGCSNNGNEVGKAAPYQRAHSESISKDLASHPAEGLFFEQGFLEGLDGLASGPLRELRTCNVGDIKGYHSARFQKEKVKGGDITRSDKDL
jgi:hypothetical protein